MPEQSPRNPRASSASSGPHATALSDAAMLTRMLNTEPLSDTRQQQLMRRYRAGVLAIRRELLRMPEALELLAKHHFAYGALSERDRLVVAIDKTSKLWGSRDSSASWEQRYTRQLFANAKLAWGAVEEIPSISQKPYADVLSLDKQLQHKLLAAAQMGRATRHPRQGVRIEESLVQMPAERIQLSAKRITAALEKMTPIQHQMVISNLRLVADRINQRLGMKIEHPNFADYLDGGAMGLIMAIHRFEPGRDTKFSTYAVEWIDNQILDQSRKEAFIQVSDRERNLLRRATSTYERLLYQHGAPPSPEQLYDHLKFTAAQLNTIRRARPQQRLSSSPGATSTWNEVEYLSSLAFTTDSSAADLVNHELIDLIQRASVRLFDGILLKVMQLSYLGPDAAPHGSARSTIRANSQRLKIPAESLNHTRRRGEEQLTDYMVLFLTPAKERSEALACVLTKTEQKVISNLLAPTYMQGISKAEQATVLLKASQAILLISAGERSFISLARKINLAAQYQEIIQNKIFRRYQSWHKTAINSSATTAASDDPMTIPTAHARFLAAIRKVAPHMRQRWREQHR